MWWIPDNNLQKFCKVVDFSTKFAEFAAAAGAALPAEFAAAAAAGAGASTVVAAAAASGAGESAVAAAGMVGHVVHCAARRDQYWRTRTVAARRDHHSHD